MRIRFNPRWLLASVLLFSFQLCRAQIVIPDNISFDLGANAGDGTQLWDLTGLYSLDLFVNQHNGLSQEIGLGFIMTHNANGSLTGPTNDVQTLSLGDNNFFPVTYIIRGKVTGSGGTAHVRATIRLISAGPGNLGNQEIDTFSATITINAEADSTTGGQLVGTAKFSGRFGNHSLNGPIDFTTALPTGVDGTWTLGLQLAGTTPIAGTTTLGMPNETFGMNVSGAFKNNSFKLTAKGANVANVNSGVGSSASILLAPTFDSFFLKGSLLGQRMLINFPTD